MNPFFSKSDTVTVYLYWHCLFLLLLAFKHYFYINKWKTHCRLTLNYFFPSCHITQPHHLQRETATQLHQNVGDTIGECEAISLELDLHLATLIGHTLY